MKRKQKILCISFLFLWFLSVPPIWASSDDCAQGNHQDIILAQTPPTETEDGSVTYQCTVCGREYTDNLPPTGHHWDNWITEKAPTCTKEGLRSRICSLHGDHTEYEVVPALGHHYEQHIKEPSETEAGLITYTCSACGDTYTESFGEPYGPPHHHIYDKIIEKEASCTESGILAYVCKEGDDRYTVPIAPLGHKFGDWITETPASEKVQGLQYRTCTGCGIKEMQVLPVLPAAPLFNGVDAVIHSVNLALLSLFAAVLLPYVFLFNWHGKKKKAHMKRQEQKRAEEKTYDFH